MRPRNMGNRNQHSRAPLSNLPFPISAHRLWICLLLITLSFHTTTGRAAKSPYETIEQAASYIVKHQNVDGGWPLVPGGDSDVEITAIAMQALMLKGWGSGSSVIRRGVAHLIKNQKSNGSWNDNTAHTIFAIIALKRAETNTDEQFNGLQWLREVQKGSGSWGRGVRESGNPLYTGAVLSGLGQLGFNQKFSPVLKAADWLAGQINYDGGWSMQAGLGSRSDVLVTSWVLQGLSIVYDIDEQLAWLKKMQNDDGGFGKWKGAPSDPEITAYAVLALVIGEDPLNADKVALRYLREVQQEDGSFVSATPIELKQPTANLQTTCFVLWAIYGRQLKEKG